MHFGSQNAVCPNCERDFVDNGWYGGFCSEQCREESIKKELV